MQKKLSRIPSCQLPKPALVVLRLFERGTVPADVWAFLLAWCAIVAVKSGLLEGVPL